MIVSLNMATTLLRVEPIHRYRWRGWGTRIDTIIGVALATVPQPERFNAST